MAETRGRVGPWGGSARPAPPCTDGKGRRGHFNPERRTAGRTSSRRLALPGSWGYPLVWDWSSEAVGASDHAATLISERMQPSLNTDTH